MRRRRNVAAATLLVVIGGILTFISPQIVHELIGEIETATLGEQVADGPAMIALEELEVKGRAPKTGYSRGEFGDGWATVLGCTTRNIILHRDLDSAVVDDECRVVSGTLQDTYTGETIVFSIENASTIQIDHVVALSDAWQKGAQLLSAEQRRRLANDPLEILAVSGPANQQKGDADAATWLPSNKPFRCQYVARQIAIKKKYRLWVTEAEKTAMTKVLSRCPEEPIPGS